MKKLLCLVLAIATLSLTSCMGKVSDSDIASARETVTSFTDKLCAGDLSALNDYVIAEDALDDLGLDFDKILRDSFVEGLGDFSQYFDDETTDNILSSVTKLIFDSVSCDIQSVDADPENQRQIAANVKVTMPDFENMNDDAFTNDIDVEQEIYAALGVDSEEDFIDLILKKSNLTLEEFVSKYSDASEEELTGFMLGIMKDVLEPCMVSIYSKAIENMDIKEYNLSLILKNMDNEWKIIDVKEL